MNVRIRRSSLSPHWTVGRTDTFVGELLSQPIQITVQGTILEIWEGPYWAIVTIQTENNDIYRIKVL